MGTFLFLILFLLLYLALKFFPDLTSEKQKPYAEIVKDELAPIVGVLALSCVALITIYTAVVLFIQSSTTRIETVIKLENWLDKLNEASGILNKPIGIIIFLFATIFLISVFQVVYRINSFFWTR